ncbi:MAG: glutamate dehydrogenase, partial [Alphaproteobacteria bacterium]
AASEGMITKDNADKIKAPLIIEAANGPITAEADKVLRAKGTIIIPDVYANAGGVIVSYFEWTKNLTHMRFGQMQRRESAEHRAAIVRGVEMMTGKPFPDELKDTALRAATELDLVRSGLDDIMRDGYAAISECWNSRDDIPDLRIAAMVIAIQRIADSYRSLGI